MDNQNPKKKNPFGRDDRSGRSFFRTRHEEGESSSETSEKPTPRRSSSEKPANPAPRKSPAKPAFPAEKKRTAPKPESDPKRYPRKSENSRPEKKRTGEGPESDAPRYPRKSADSRPEKTADRRGYRDRPERPQSESRYAKRTEKPAGRDKFSKKSAPQNKELPSELRLNRYIAMSGVCSRREADALIAAGEVTVNGQVVSELGSKVKISDEIRLNGELLKGEKKVYIVLNKPKGYVTTMEDPHADKTVIDLLKGKVPERVYPVGRLDKNTTGVLLLTNDGALTKELTHPSYEKKKIYHVFLDKPCTEEDLVKLTAGLELEDGPIKADAVSYVDDKGREVGLELHSGRNRIVRRMFESMGYEVVKLDRVYFAGLTKMGLRRGFWRALTPREVAALKSGAYE